MILGIHLQLMIGPTIAMPATPDLTEALHSVQITHNDEGKSGFQITFQVGRTSLADTVDYSILNNPLLQPFNRVVLTVVFNVVPRVLMDGIITNRQLSPGDAPGSSTLTVTGEDVSVMMDLKKLRAEHPAQPEPVIALKIIGQYAQYGLIPNITPPGNLEVPVPTDHVPVQQATDLEHLNEMARRFGYVFYIIPGPAPMMNTAYWGPPIRAGVLQRALSVNVGPESNVSSVNFQYNALAPTLVLEQVQDSDTEQALPVMTFFSQRIPLASMPALPARTAFLEDRGRLSQQQAQARAQSMTDRSVDNVLTGQGELDALRYGDILMPRALVGLRGAGFRHDGVYYVKSVTHTISRGQYKQRFTITREGDGALTPAVIP